MARISQNGRKRGPSARRAGERTSSKERARRPDADTPSVSARGREQNGKPASASGRAAGFRRNTPAARATPGAHDAPAFVEPVGEPEVRVASKARRAALSGERVESRGKYVYCIVRTKEPLSFGRIGLGVQPADIQTVNYRDVAAVISDTPPGILDPTRENVLAHQRVNEIVMEKHTVIPMSFGTIFKTRDDIVELLRSAYDAFADVLDKMENKVEFGLKVLWDRDQIIREIEREDEDIRRVKSQIALQKGSTYFARMQYGRMMEGALQARAERYVADVFAALRDSAVASRSNKPIGDRMILNAAFLVARNREKAFDAKVKAIGNRYNKLTFRYTGPWPPYNFVNIRLRLERAQ